MRTQSWKGVLPRPNPPPAARILDDTREITIFSISRSFPQNRVCSCRKVKVLEVKLFLIVKLITAIFVVMKKIDEILKEEALIMRINGVP